MAAYLVQHYTCALSLEEADAWAWYSVTLADHGLLISQFMTNVAIQERSKLVHDICIRQKLKYPGLTTDVVVRERMEPWMSKRPLGFTSCVL